MYVTLRVDYKMYGVSAQTDFGCFTSPGCTTGNIAGPLNSEDCCVNTPAGMYFSNGGECLQCIGKLDIYV